jgi:hypothetical protein
MIPNFFCGEARCIDVPVSFRCHESLESNPNIRLIPVVRNNVVPHVEDFVRYAEFDVNEVADRLRSQSDA